MVETRSGSPREAASEAADESARLGGEIKETATRHAGDLAGEARAQARNVMDETRHELRKQLDTGGERLGRSVRDAADQLRSMADDAPPGIVSDITHQVGDGLASVAATVDREGVQGLADDLRGFARRQPALFLAGAGVAGFLVARLLRSGAMSAASDGSDRAPTPGQPTWAGPDVAAGGSPERGTVPPPPTGLGAAGRPGATP